jgi:hypothetical protein
VDQTDPGSSSRVSQISVSSPCIATARQVRGVGSSPDAPRIDVNAAQRRIARSVGPRWQPRSPHPLRIEESTRSPWRSAGVSNVRSRAVGTRHPVQGANVCRRRREHPHPPAGTELCSPSKTTRARRRTLARVLRPDAVRPGRAASLTAAEGRSRQRHLHVWATRAPAGMNTLS